MEDEPDDAERTRRPLMGDLVGICRELNRIRQEYDQAGGGGWSYDSFRLAHSAVENETDFPGEGPDRPIVPPQAARRSRRVAGGVRWKKPAVVAGFW